MGRDDTGMAARWSEKSECGRSAGLVDSTWAQLPLVNAEWLIWVNVSATGAG